MARTGRPKRPAIDVFRTKAWFSYAKRRAGVATAYAFAKAFASTSDKHFEKYQRGTISPNATSLLRVEKKYPGTRAVYEVGPLWEVPGTGGIPVPLWTAMAGSMEDTWLLLARFDATLERLRLSGAPYFDRIKRLLAILSPLPSIKIDRFAPGREMSNDIARLHGLGHISLDLPLLAAVLAMWRYSMFVGDGWREMDYVVRGLCMVPGVLRPTHFYIDPVTALLEPWEIDSDFSVFLEFLRRQNRERYLPTPEAVSQETFPLQYLR